MPDSESASLRGTVDEQLDQLDVTCGTHGVLASGELSVTLGGRLVCAFCSMNQELDVNDERDIDASVRVELQ